jgi:hypothetical protein
VTAHAGRRHRHRWAPRHRPLHRRRHWCPHQRSHWAGVCSARLQQAVMTAPRCSPRLLPQWAVATTRGAVRQVTRGPLLHAPTRRGCLRQPGASKTGEVGGEGEQRGRHLFGPFDGHGHGTTAPAPPSARSQAASGTRSAQCVTRRTGVGIGGEGREHSRRSTMAGAAHATTAGGGGSTPSHTSGTAHCKRHSCHKRVQPVPLPVPFV